MTHTATRWKLELGSKEDAIIYYDKGMIKVLSIDPKDYNAHAEYIVKAVNSHEELLKTTKMFRAVLVGELVCEPHFLEKLEATIAKAKGK